MMRRQNSVLNVFFTVDVEIWGSRWWNHIGETFLGDFQRYIYGPTSKGDYGLPFILKLLKEYGLKGVFFVEPLFSTRFGRQPLEEIVGLLREAFQEIQLHLHTEWVDESIEPILDGIVGKRQHLRNFSLEEQIVLVNAGKRLIMQAGSGNITAFRAGNFGFNKDTLCALRANSIAFDSSYNARMFGFDSGVFPGVTIVDAVECEGVFEYPMTVFNDGTRALRLAQLTACSYKEMEGLLWQALESERKSFVILSHNFELLNKEMNRPDDVVVERFRKMCSFLDRNRDSFRVCGFDGLQVQIGFSQPSPLVSPLWKTGARMLEQAYRWRYK